MRQLRAPALAMCAATFALGACASAPPAVQVNTTVAPQAQLAAYRTFHILTPQMPSTNPAAQDDPMIDNSVTNRALRTDIRQALVARGYAPVPSPDEADLKVAYYTAAKQTLDVQTVNYGYPYRPWWYGAREQQVVTPIEQGTVVIDLIDRRTNQLVWRGTGRTQITQDQAKYTEQLGRAVADVLQKLPQHAA